MKAQCDRATLTEGVQAALGVVPHRSPKPALGCIKVEAATGAVTLLATDLEVGIRVSLTKVDVQEPGTCLVPAERLHAILRELEVETVAVSSGDRETEIVAPGAAGIPSYVSFVSAGLATLMAMILLIARHPNAFGDEGSWAWFLLRSRIQAVALAFSAKGQGFRTAERAR